MRRLARGTVREFEVLARERTSLRAPELHPGTMMLNEPAFVCQKSNLHHARNANLHHAITGVRGFMALIGISFLQSGTVGFRSVHFSTRRK